jgi:hypothetical protein
MTPSLLRPGQATRPASPWAAMHRPWREGTQLGVLVDDRLADRWNTAAQQLLGDRPLLRGNLIEERVAVLAGRSKALLLADWFGASWPGGAIRAGAAFGPCTLGPRCSLWPRATIWPRVAIGSVGASGPRALHPRASTLTTRTVRAVTCGAVASISARPITTVAAVLCILYANIRPVIWACLDLDALGRFGPGCFRGHNCDNGHPVETSFDLGTNNVTDPGTWIQRSGGDGTLRLFGPSSAPSPLIAGLAGEFDVDAVGHSGLRR